MITNHIFFEIFVFRLKRCVQTLKPTKLCEASKVVVQYCLETKMCNFVGVFKKT